jgi:hypothetical protein
MNNICAYCVKECKNKNDNCDDFIFNLEFIKIDENIKDCKPADRIKTLK